MDKKMIERLKNNTTPLGLLPKEMQVAFADADKEGLPIEVWVHGAGWKESVHWNYGQTYRLSQDYEEPKRWFFCLDNLEIHNSTENVCDDCIEVQEIDLPYLEKPEGDWEFRKVEKGDTILAAIGQTFLDTPRLVDACQGEMSGYRWCKPRKTGRWVEYPVYVKDGESEYSCRINHLDSNVYYETLPRYVGFGGVQFDGQEDDTWYLNVVALQCPSGEIAPCWCEDKTDKVKPATPIKSRFWVEG